MSKSICRYNTYKMKYYAVKSGKQPGVYLTWAECQKNVTGVSNSVFKSFSTLEEAEAFVKGSEHALQTDEKFDNDVYTDGSATGGKAGSAVIDVNGNRIITSAVPGEQTNNRGELYAIRCALFYTQGSICIYSDSQYSINVCTGAVNYYTNQDIIEEIKSLMKDRRVVFKHVLAHRGNKYNELADKYANEARSLNSMEVKMITVEL